jgi:hypothetical protein
MSALGHKQTFAVQKGMSALPPKAEMCGALADVRKGQKRTFKFGSHPKGKTRGIAGGFAS